MCLPRWVGGRREYASLGGWEEGRYLYIGLYVTLGSSVPRWESLPPWVHLTVGLVGDQHAGSAAQGGCTRPWL